MSPQSLVFYVAQVHECHSTPIKSFNSLSLWVHLHYNVKCVKLALVSIVTLYKALMH